MSNCFEFSLNTEWTENYFMAIWNGIFVFLVVNAQQATAVQQVIASSECCESACVSNLSCHPPHFYYHHWNLEMITRDHWVVSRTSRNPRYNLFIFAVHHVSCIHVNTTCAWPYSRQLLLSFSLVSFQPWRSQKKHNDKLMHVTHSIRSKANYIELASAKYLFYTTTSTHIVFYVSNTAASYAM